METVARPCHSPLCLNQHVSAAFKFHETKCPAWIAKSVCQYCLTHDFLCDATLANVRHLGQEAMPIPTIGGRRQANALDLQGRACSTEPLTLWGPPRGKGERSQPSCV
jgi:hypothetical protein